MSQLARCTSLYRVATHSGTHTSGGRRGSQWLGFRPQLGSANRQHPEYRKPNTEYWRLNVNFKNPQH